MNEPELASVCIIVGENGCDNSTQRLAEELVNRVEHTRTDDWDDADIGLSLWSNVMSVWVNGESEESLSEDHADYREFLVAVDEAFSNVDGLYLREEIEAIKSLAFRPNRAYTRSHAFFLVHPWGDRGQEMLREYLQREDRSEIVEGLVADENVITAGEIAYIIAKLERFDAVDPSSSDDIYRENLNELTTEYRLHPHGEHITQPILNSIQSSIQTEE